MTDDSSADGSQPVPKIDSSVPHSARIWNYWLEGKDNYPVDRATGDQIQELHPGIVTYARADRAFLGRAVRYLVGEVGIRQFLDIGTGLPTVDNTHEVAQEIAPEARVVYVDNDPLVLVHARALLTSTPEGATDYLDADLHEPEKILAGAEALLDFSQPIAVMLLGVVNFVNDTDQAYSIIKQLVDAVPAGSYLVISHTTTSPAMDAAVAFWNTVGTPKLTQRTPDQVARFFEGLELVPPGVVSCSRWRADATSDEVALYCGVARKS